MINGVRHKLNLKERNQYGRRLDTNEKINDAIDPDMPFNLNASISEP